MERPSRRRGDQFVYPGPEPWADGPFPQPRRWRDLKPTGVAVFDIGPEGVTAYVAFNEGWVPDESRWCCGSPDCDRDAHPTEESARYCRRGLAAREREGREARPLTRSLMGL